MALTIQHNNFELDMIGTPVEVSVFQKDGSPGGKFLGRSAGVLIEYAEGLNDVNWKVGASASDAERIDKGQMFIGIKTLR